MTPSEWLLKRARLNHHDVRNRLMLSLAGLRGVLGGRVTDAGEAHSRIQSLSVQMAEVEALTMQLLDRMEEAMSPKPIVAHVFRDLSEDAAVLIEFAHQLWLETSGVSCLRSAVLTSLENSVANCAELTLTDLSNNAACSVLGGILSELTKNVTRLSEALSALPRHPGLCFQYGCELADAPMDNSDRGRKPERAVPS